MYLQHFGLAEKPFAITPDPRYLYLGSQHADAIAHLAYGIKDAGGFIQLTGEVGTGKTTTIRSLLSRAPENADIALIINPRMTPIELLQTICEEFGLGTSNSAAGDAKDLTDQLNRYLLRVHASGRRAVLIIDEAQALTPEVLEQVRLLTNLETASQKLLQIILIGQPELRELLKREDLRQLAQRVTARYHLDPLSRAECIAYVRHRLRVAGATREIFGSRALAEVYRQSRGVPRVINVICDRALLGAYTTEQHQISVRMVQSAADEVFDRRSWPRWLAPVVATATIAVIAGAGYALYRAGVFPGQSTAPPADPAAPPASGSLASPPPVAPAPKLVALGELLAAPGAITSSDAAFAELFKLWSATYQTGSVDGCTQAQNLGLECLSMRGSLALLRQFNRPAMLLLGDDQRPSAAVVLSGLEAERATLRLGDAVAEVRAGDLAAHWYGDFVLLWKPSSVPYRPLSPGMHGPAVQRVRARLRQLAGLPAVNSEEPQYDAELQDQVRQFQEAHHLDVDGVVGAVTELQLEAALAAAGTPWLQPPAATPATSASTNRPRN